jgi:hypothetical protein
MAKLEKSLVTLAAIDGHFHNRVPFRNEVMFECIFSVLVESLNTKSS